IVWNHSGSLSIPANQLGKSAGIYYADVDGRRIIWADMTTFNQDVTQLYDSIDQVALNGAGLVAQITGSTVTCSGTVQIDANYTNYQYGGMPGIYAALNGTGSHFTTELAPKDWICISTSSHTSSWYQVVSITSDTF